MTPEKRTCATCAAYDADAFICRRNPPRTDGWPGTSATDWCLAHKATEPATPDKLGLAAVGWETDLFGDLTELLDWLGEGKTVPEIGQYLGLNDAEQVTLALAMEQLRDIGITRQKKWKIMRATAEADEPEAPRYKPSVKPAATYTEQEFLACFPFGEKAAQPLPVIRKRAVSNLCISDAKFGDERFNLLTAGKINKVTMPNGEERYFR